MKERKTTYTQTIRRVGNNKCAIFDLDSSLCDHGTQTGFTRVDLFAPIAPVVELAKLVKSWGYDIVIATARPDGCHWQTVAWLDKHLPEWDGLYMKNRYVKLPGSVCKEDQLAAIDERWDVAFAIDDSPFNARMFEDNGVPCLRPTCNDAFWAGYGDN